MVRAKSKTLDMVYIAIGAVLIAICSWIAIPTAIPVTLQTFAVFAVLGLLGGKRGTVSILIYILLGAIGIPVFSGFTGGVGIILGTTGGYIVGFIGIALVMWAMEKIPANRTLILALSMVIGLLVLYAFGTLWYMMVYAKNTGAVGIATVLGWCVLPFIIPDMLKIGLALLMTKRLGRYVQ